MKTLTSVLLALLASITINSANAGQLAGVSVINQTTGEHLPVWRYQGNNYIAGNPGDRYAIKVMNKTGSRILSVLSVDGINVLTGANASPMQSGYVLDAWQAIDVKGWRKNMDEVAAFYFTQLPDSYAARTGRPDNAGVIGVALFREYIEPAISEYQRSSPAAAAPAPITGSLAKSQPSSADSMAEARIGTGHGERIDSSVTSTDFRRASSHPDEVISIRYDTYAHLVARGIIPRAHRPDVNPNPFPGNFVPDPQ